MTERTVDPALETFPRMLHKEHERRIVNTREELAAALDDGFTAHHSEEAKALEAEAAAEGKPVEKLARAKDERNGDTAKAKPVTDKAAPARKA